jgi:hypothetical protein
MITPVKSFNPYPTIFKISGRGQDDTGDMLEMYLTGYMMDFRPLEWHIHMTLNGLISDILIKCLK